MRILESYQDIETYLRGAELFETIINNFGDKFYNKNKYGEVVDFVQEYVESKFEINNIEVERVIICKVVGDELDLVDTDQYVINYNGTYYDFCAQRFNNSFNNLITSAIIPVVQKVVHSDKLITDKLSTVKGYVILGY